MSLSIFLEKASRSAIFLLSGLLVYHFALLTWSIFTTESSKYQWVMPIMEMADNNSLVDTQALQDFHLFGEHRDLPVSVNRKKTVREAPAKKLNLVLVGVVMATEPGSSSAIISEKNKQGSYFINSKIAGATVSEIYEDHVVLEVNGRLQTLMLDGVKQIKQPIKPQVNNNIAKMSDYIVISPYRKDGKLAGYRIKPGKKRSLFDQAGLKDNDLAIELNGVDLTNAQQVLQLMKEFPVMEELSLTVQRNSQLYELYLKIP